MIRNFTLNNGPIFYYQVSELFFSLDTDVFTFYFFIIHFNKIKDKRTNKPENVKYIKIVKRFTTFINNDISLSYFRFYCNHRNVYIISWLRKRTFTNDCNTTISLTLRK